MSDKILTVSDIANIAFGAEYIADDCGFAVFSRFTQSEREAFTDSADFYKY